MTISGYDCWKRKGLSRRRKLGYNQQHSLPWAPVGFFPGVGKLGVWRQKSPSRVQAWSPSGCMGARGKAPKSRWKSV